MDGIEVANRGNDESADALAYRYAAKLKKPMTAGSDIHNAKLATNENVFGVYLDKKLNSIQDYVKAICNNEIAGLKTDKSRLVFHGTENVMLPVDVRDENDRVTGKSWKEVI